MVVGAVALLWLLACTNVAGVQMARKISREHEMSTRLALGASNRRLFAQASAESLFVAMAGSLLGVALAQAVIDAIRHFAPASLPRLANLQLGWTAASAAFSCMLISTVFFTPFSRRIILSFFE